ncbi:hypothetical protein PCE1_004835 [Barthelona sp. PCE]
MGPRKLYLDDLPHCIYQGETLINKQCFENCFLLTFIISTKFASSVSLLKRVNDVYRRLMTDNEGLHQFVFLLCPCEPDDQLFQDIPVMEEEIAALEIDFPILRFTHIHEVLNFYQSVSIFRTPTIQVYDRKGVMVAQNISSYFFNAEKAETHLREMLRV